RFYAKRAGFRQANSRLIYAAYDTTGTSASGVPTFSGAYVVNSAVLSVATGAAIGTAVTFDTERYDTDGYHSTSSNTDRLTAPTTGYYAYGGGGTFVANATGDRQLIISHSNTSNHPNLVFTGKGTANFLNGMVVSGEANFTAGEYVSAQVLQDSGGNLN